MGKITVGIDPGKHGSGVAVFDGGHLVETHWIDYESAAVAPDYVDLVVLEHMQVDGRTRGKAQDVIDCQLGGALLAGALRPRKLILVPPRTWKGSVPKTIHHRRILAKLTNEEIAITDQIRKKRSDILDAIGIGLWALGR